MLRLEHLAELAACHASDLAVRVEEFDLGGRHFAWNTRPALMGVINLSPDSWYRESVVLDPRAALRRGTILAAQGADLVDVGAESTLPHADRVTVARQTDRLVPVIRGLHERGILVSAETYHPEVAQACLEAGASVLNLTGTDPTESIFRLAAAFDAGVILCYVQGENVREVGALDLRSDPVPLLHDFFARQIDRATRCGVRRLLIDPGLGFYYRNLTDGTDRVRHQMAVFLHTFRLRRLGWPVCHALPHAFESFGDEVRTAEPFFAVLAALGRTDLFRTHELPRVRAVLETLAAF
ncbi:MAG: dihydropteroate synthase [Verrucomicrobiae bacterium]|nr:dihydropteroate synthase [Verrucomicrobiae bacterium]